MPICDIYINTDKKLAKLQARYDITHMDESVSVNCVSIINLWIVSGSFKYKTKQIDILRVQLLFALIFVYCTFFGRYSTLGFISIVLASLRIDNFLHTINCTRDEAWSTNFIWIYFQKVILFTKCQKISELKWIVNIENCKLLYFANFSLSLQPSFSIYFALCH